MCAMGGVCGGNVEEMCRVWGDLVECCNEFLEESWRIRVGRG